MLGYFIKKEIKSNVGVFIVECVVFGILISMMAICCYYFYSLPMTFSEQLNNDDSFLPMLRVENYQNGNEYIQSCELICDAKDAIDFNDNFEIVPDDIKGFFIQNNSNLFLDYLVKTKQIDIIEQTKSPNNNIWISTYISDRLNLKINDSMELTTIEGNKINCKIEGIYNINGTFTSQYIIMIPKSIVNISNFIVASDDIKTIFNVAARFDKENISYEDVSGLIEIKNRIRLSEVILIVLILFLFSLISFVFYKNYLKTYSKRKKYMFLLSDLGLEYHKINNIYLMLVILKITCGEIISILIYTLCIYSLNNVIKEYFILSNNIFAHIYSYITINGVLFALVLVLWIIIVINGKRRRDERFYNINNKRY